MAWNPWGALRDNSDLLLAFDARATIVGGGIFIPVEGGGVIFLSRNLGQQDRNVTLAHELIHSERGGGASAPWMPSTWADVVTRDEHQVDDEVARRLVPRGELIDLIARACSIDGAGGAVEVAEAFDVPEEVAERALRLLEAEW